MILVVDNYDSFTYNLVHLLEELGGEVVVRRNDAPGLEQLEPSHLVLSPGPGQPPPRIVELVRDTRARTLGVCLGHRGDRLGIRRRDRPGRPRRAPGEPRRPRRAGHLRRPSGRGSTPGATTRSQR